jgi:hypothetical protein
MTNARIEFETITAGTFPGLKELVIEQARHHDSTYRGDDAAFIETLQRPDPVAQVLMVRDDDTQEPLGYILFNHNYGLKGQELYMEDILVSGKQRSQGFGLAMTEVLKEKGRQLGVEAVTWTVAENNPAGIRFYENKMHASPQPYGIYDCTSVLAASPPVHNSPPPAASADYEVRRVDKGDLELLESYVGRLPGLDEKRMKNISAAASAMHADVYIALGPDGTPKALGITNSNYSSFRTVYGYKFEVMELAATDTADAAGAFRALTAEVVKQAHASAHEGHLNIYIDKSSPAQNQFIQSLGVGPLQMTDDPASVFLFYGIGRDIIYAPVPKNVVNKNVVNKGPENPPAPKA